MNYNEDLKNKLPELKKIEGFPIGADEDILALSEPPYYTACPNPYIADFIKENGKPYDEATDDYHREPLTGDVSEGKGHAIYNAHSYHTKVPHQAIMKFINHYTNNNEIVLDGFCGTGMTGVAAQLCNRKAVLSDLSPIASLIAFNYNNPVDIALFKQNTTAIIDDIENECKWLYETLHTDGKTIGTINFVVWSDVLISPFSGNEFNFYDVAVDKVNGKVLEEFLCPDTGATLTKKNCKRATIEFFDDAINQNITQIKQNPVLINYSINEKRSGKNKSVAYEKKPDIKDIELIESINKKPIPYWYPIQRMSEGGETRRNDKFGLTHVHHLFTKRNLWILSELKNRCKTPLQTIWFNSQLVNLSKLNRYRPGVSFPYNPLSGTYYIGSQICESNVFTAYRNKLNKIVNAVKFIKDKNMVFVGSATKLPVASDSIDYIFTDPPFGDNLAYSELNFIWEAWLKVFTNIDKEGIINSSQNKGLSEYNSLMLDSFKEYYRVLKPKRWITVVFHNSKSSVWNGIQEAITKSGFIIGQVSTLDKQQGSFKQVTAPGAVEKDLVISAFKPSNEFTDSFLSKAGSNLESDFVKQLLSQLQIQPCVERTEKMLYSKMLSFYIQHGYEVNMDAKAFYKMLNMSFIELDGLWFTSVQIERYYEYKKKMKLEGIEEIKSGSMFLFVTDEKSALVWLYNFISESKSFSDIHTAFTQLANIQGDAVPELRELLEQNFVFENDKYRRPQNEPEHNQISEKREKALLREFESLLIKAKTEKGKIKLVRKEALLFGFETCYKSRRYQDILTVTNKLDKAIIENSAELNDFVEAAEIMVKGME